MSNTPDPLDHAAVVCAALRKTTATSVLIEMSGGGDSGEIYNVEINGADGQPINKNELNHDVTFNAVEREYNIINNEVKHNESTKTKTMSLIGAITLLSENMVDQTNVDWYNNDGGEGTFELDVLAGTITIVMSVHELTEVHNETTDIFWG